MSRVYEFQFDPAQPCERISAIGPSAITSVPTAAKVIDATAQFLIPGLWDTHVCIATREKTFTVLLTN
jgi:dihydroorotase-like cyclic amidohydrolase